MKHGVLILGATSSIARAAANNFAHQGYPLYLAGRDLFELERIATDIKIRHQVPVQQGHFDAEAFESHPAFFRGVIEKMRELEGVLLAFGELGEEKIAQNDFNAAKKILDNNFIGACSILITCSQYFIAKKKGFILAISSVAGDRGRQANYVYGSSKAGLSLFLQGLRNKVCSAGVRVITIKPGFVDTAMTYGQKNMFLVASPKYVGDTIAHSVKRWKDVVYVPFFWRYIMWIIKMIPEKIFKRLKI